MKKRIVIVGGVAGGASAAARLRRLSEETEIILLEKGEYISFANCGLPYHIGGSIESREALLVQTVEGMSKRFNLDIRPFNEALSIDREAKKLTVRDIKKHENYDLDYDVLLLSPGASPMRPPIPGLEEAGNIFTLRNIPDTDVIKNFVDVRKPERAVVIGGGFIGIEMAENLVDRGIKVTLIEASDQVMAPFDPEMAAYLHNHLREHGVDLILGDGVDRFEEEGKVVVTSSGKKVNTDLVILSIGVRPDSGLAKDAGLEVNQRGFIKVNEKMQTSDPSIYAVGDAIESFDFIYKEPMNLALASPANRQARIAANVIMGKEDNFKGFFGTSVAKVFDFTAASTGWNEKRLKQAGKKYHSILLHPMNHAGYYPGAEAIHMKVLFEVPSGRVLGAQAIGKTGTEKRIDVIATAIAAGFTVDDLTDLELAYAPPFSSAKDPVNMAGYMGQNVLDGMTEDLDVTSLDEKVEEGAVLIDVRNEEEILLGAFPKALNIPLDELRGSLDKVPKDKELLVTCQVGVRGYLAQQVLKAHGIASKNLKGGYTAYREIREESPVAQAGGPVVPEGKTIFCTDNPDILKKEPPKEGDVVLDARGLQCPGPIAKVYRALNEMKDGEILEVKATDPGFKRDIGAWCGKTGNRLISLTDQSGYALAYIAKGQGEVAVKEIQNGATMVVFSGDFDKAMAALIIATGAASMGKKVTMFFTFWGLNILRKEGVNVEKEGMEKMFSKMMPEGVENLKLSKMNMMGMGTSMMKKVMEEKNVDSPATLLKQALDLGVELVACAMSMDIMGIKEEELIDGVSVAGVATYLAKTEESGLNLFI